MKERRYGSSQCVNVVKDREFPCNYPVVLRSTRDSKEGTLYLIEVFVSDFVYHLHVLYVFSGVAVHDLWDSLSGPDCGSGNIC